MRITYTHSDWCSQWFVKFRSCTKMVYDWRQTLLLWVEELAQVPTCRPSFSGFRGRNPGRLDSVHTADHRQTHQSRRWPPHCLPSVSSSSVSPSAQTARWMDSAASTVKTHTTERDTQYGGSYQNIPSPLDYISEKWEVKVTWRWLSFIIHLIPGRLGSTSLASQPVFCCRVSPLPVRWNLGMKREWRQQKAGWLCETKGSAALAIVHMQSITITL